MLVAMPARKLGSRAEAGFCLGSTLASAACSRTACHVDRDVSAPAGPGRRAAVPRSGGVVADLPARPAGRGRGSGVAPGRAPRRRGGAAGQRRPRGVRGDRGDPAAARRRQGVDVAGVCGVGAPTLALSHAASGGLRRRGHRAVGGRPYRAGRGRLVPTAGRAGSGAGSGADRSRGSGADPGAGGAVGAGACRRRGAVPRRGVGVAALPPRPQRRVRATCAKGAIPARPRRFCSTTRPPTSDSTIGTGEAASRQPYINPCGSTRRFPANRSPPKCVHCQVHSGYEDANAEATGLPCTAQQASLRPCVHTSSNGPSTSSPTPPRPLATASRSRCCRSS